MFNFEQIALGAGVNVTIIGVRPIALVSRSSLRLNTTLHNFAGSLGGFPGAGELAHDPSPMTARWYDATVTRCDPGAAGKVYSVRYEDDQVVRSGLLSSSLRRRASRNSAGMSRTVRPFWLSRLRVREGHRNIALSAGWCGEAARLSRGILSSS